MVQVLRADCDHLLPFVSSEVETQLRAKRDEQDRAAPQPEGHAGGMADPLILGFARQRFSTSLEPNGDESL
jgi:hypothetical protein